MRWNVSADKNRSFPVPSALLDTVPMKSKELVVLLTPPLPTPLQRSWLDMFLCIPLLLASVLPLTRDGNTSTFHRALSATSSYSVFRASIIDNFQNLDTTFAASVQSAVAFRFGRARNTRDSYVT